MAFIDKSIIDEIKSKNDIVDVIGSYISLNDKNKALCPFHDDHSPSFSVQKDKQIYKCFSCGESGNVITFVQKYNGITFTEALKMLADRAGIPSTDGRGRETEKIKRLEEGSKICLWMGKRYRRRGRGVSHFLFFTLQEIAFL